MLAPPKPKKKVTLRFENDFELTTITFLEHVEDGVERDEIIGTDTVTMKTSRTVRINNTVALTGLLVLLTVILLVVAVIALI